MFTALLFLLAWAGAAPALEIETVEGRPWDTGAIGVDDHDKNHRVYHKDPNAYLGTPDDDIFRNDGRAKTLGEWFSVIRSYLHP
jgi:hypothetical protein